MNFPLPNFIPTEGAIEVLDSTKLKNYSRCPRYFFFQNILGWKPDVPEHDLVVGISWHLAMEHFMANVGHYDRALVEAIEAYMSYYRQYFSEETDVSSEPKDPANVCKALIQYTKQYAGDSFEVIYTEVAGVVPVTEKYNIYFKMDALCRGEYERGAGDCGSFVFEHKTTKTKNPIYSKVYTMSPQIGTYLHVANLLSERVYGVVVNQPILQKELKKGGGGNEFRRFRVTKTPEQMADWQYSMEMKFRRIEWDFTRLAECKQDDVSMAAFDKNEEACIMYNRLCPFYEFCNAWPNPLARCENPPPGFRKEHWDPRDLQREAKYVMKDGKLERGNNELPKVVKTEVPQNVVEEGFFNA